jgi:hypothetical protein
MRLDGMGDPWTPYLNDVHMEFVLGVTEASASNTSTSDPTSNSASNSTSNSASNAGSNAGSNSASRVHRDHGNSDDVGTDDRVFDDDDESSRTSEEIDLMKTRRTHDFESTTHLGSTRYPDFTTATSRIDSPADSEVKEKMDTLSASSDPSTTSSRLYIPSSNGFPSIDWFKLDWNSFSTSKAKRKMNTSLSKTHSPKRVPSVMPSGSQAGDTYNLEEAPVELVDFESRSGHPRRNVQAEGIALTRIDRGVEEENLSAQVRLHRLLFTNL